MERHLYMDECISSPSLHRVYHRKRPRLCKQKALNQNSSFSLISVNQQSQKKSKRSLSYTSLNSYLKEFDLSEKDFAELRQALKRIFHYFQPKIRCDQKQRLTSPYLQQKLITDDRSSLPLYTNEYFIRNGLLNHNDGPEIYDDIFSSRNIYHSNHSKSILRFESCSTSLPSSMNISLPLSLLSSRKYLFTALSSNFASEKPKRSLSSMGLTLIEYSGKNSDNETETKSMIVRRHKVQTWERENILQKKMSIEHFSTQKDNPTEMSVYHRSSIVQTPSINNIEKTTKMTEELIAESSSSLRTCDKEERNDQLLKSRKTDDLFPMVKRLAPYIIIRDSFHLRTNDKQSLPYISQSRTASKKRSLTDAFHSILDTAKRQSRLLSSSSTVHRTDNEEQRLRQKKNYLLNEFESVLTPISKK